MQMQKSLKNYRHLAGNWVTRFWLMSLALWFLAGLETPSHAQLSLNVTNFGARGDAVQFYVNTVSNSLVINTTNYLSSADIGKAIEVFGCGNVTTAPNCQDLIATITDVVNGTNVYITQFARKTLSGAFATYGHENSANFQAAISAAGGGTNSTISIPSGKYLFLATGHPGTYGTSSVWLYGGGIHLVGEGITNTVLLSQGAWNMQGIDAWRGSLFVISAPITNDFPFSIENLTLDGGVLQGNTGNHGFPASTTDGSGWDVTHDAITVVSAYGGANTFTHQIWTNVMFTHWRGEMVKSLDQSKNGNLSMLNCIFADGNATAINIYAALDINNCVFSNLFQVGEYYQEYSTNTSYFRNSYVTNITGNGFALNGAKGSNPPFIIQSNVFCFASGFNGIVTTPGDNISIISNLFIYPYNSYGVAIDLGAPGYQGTFDNSNIVIQGNSFIEPMIVVEIFGGGPTDQNRVEAVKVFNNTITHTGPGGFSVLLCYGWSTNVHFYSNNITHTAGPLSFSSGAYGSQYALVDLDNIYYSSLFADSGGNVAVSYGSGSRYVLTYNYLNNTQYYLSDADGGQIPAGAQMFFTNSTFNSQSVPVYSDSAKTRLVTIPYGQSISFLWNGSQWTTNAAGGNLNTLTVNYGIGSGAYANGQAISITASNLLGKIFTQWTGATNILANPFAASTTATMPATNAQITANYVPVPPFNLRPLN